MYTNGSEIFNRLGLEKKQFILTQIVKEFGEAGYDSVSMRKIAQNTQVSIGSLYQYFGDKEGILKISIEHVFVILSSYIEEIKKAPLELEIRLEKMFDSICRVEEKYPEIIKFYNKIPSDKKMITEWVKQFYNNRSFFDVYWSTVKELQNEKEISTKIDPVIYTFIIDTMMLSGELLQNTQYQEIKAKVFLEDSIKSSLILKENVLETLTVLAKG
ncbi:TetR/AcrR family transcriptional regulator [Enterococcus faecalis]|nr:TetR/AcrR family transcriptional regulator [Enterococcus faecalis]